MRPFSRTHRGYRNGWGIKMASFLSPRFCRADLGWNYQLAQRVFRKIDGEFLSEFWWRNFARNFFCLIVSRISGPPKKIMPKIHAQNCWHSSPIFSNPKYSHGDFLLSGEIKVFWFLKTRHIGTRLFWYFVWVLSFAAPKAVSKRMVHQNGKSFCVLKTWRFGTRLFWYPFVLVPVWVPPIGIVQKVFSEKASAIARMRQKCVRNASKMRQKCVKMGLVLLERGTSKNASEIRQNCVKSARNTFGGEHLLDDTDPTLAGQELRTNFSSWWPHIRVFLNLGLGEPMF